MNSLLAKEIRLLLPTFVMALLLAVVPIWLVNGHRRIDDILLMVLPLLCFGALLMALTPFGREFGMGTFSLMLALPLSRARIWWIKIAVLAVGLVIVFAAGLCSWAVWNASHYYYTQKVDGETVNLFSAIHGRTTFALMCLVVFASGLWTTLLLRQVVAAFWFALLVPSAILVLILWNGGSPRLVEIALVVYSVAGFCLAWRQFYRAQEVGWTGGEVTLPAWAQADAGARSTDRAHRPLAALIRKELQLYQVALIGMAGLFILHLITVVVRRALPSGPDESILRMIMELFGGIWLIVPLITGGLNVADERRLGTLEAHLCLPISTRKQFTIKLLTVLVLSGLLSAVLLWLAEGIGGAMRAGALITNDAWLGGIKISLHGDGLLPLTLIFLGIALVVFYASTLTRSILQAIMVAVVTVIILSFAWTLTAAALRYSRSQGWPENLLLLLISVPVMLAAIVRLSYRNFCRLAETRRLWVRNIRGLSLSLLFAGALTALIFNRAWEYLMPLEPAHGPAQLSLRDAPVFRSDFANISVLLPDGRLWWYHLGFDYGPSIHLGKDNDLPLSSGRWLSAKKNPLMEKTNWADVTGNYHEMMGITTDGTLWVSDRPTRPPSVRHGKIGAFTPPKMVEAGEDHDWKRVAPFNGSHVMVLLKTDGSLWGWGTNETRNWSGFSHSKPYRLGTDWDWSDMLSTTLGTYVWKNDGRAWKVALRYDASRTNTTREDAELVLDRAAMFDQFKWRSLAVGNFVLAVRDDGTLWTFFDPAKFGNPTPAIAKQPPVQVGTGHDWVSVGSNYRMIIGLKKDGTLWKWEIEGFRWDETSLASKPPVRLGTHHDWVALAGANGTLNSLAADGSIWNWPSWGTPFMAASRRPVKLENIFTQQ